MPFFQRAKPRKAPKRKFQPSSAETDKSKKKTPNGVQRRDGDEESVDSESELDDDVRRAPDRSESEDELETAQEKKLRLAKAYLEEVEREQQQREEAVGDRLRDDYLERKGRLRREIADVCVEPDPKTVRVLRSKRSRLSVTCLCVSSDGNHIYSGTKCASILKWSIPEVKLLASVVHNKSTKCHSSPVAAIAVSTDSKYLVSCERSSEIQVWNPNTLAHVHTFKGHRDVVTGLVFRSDTHQLFSSSGDRSVKVWSLDEMAYVETVFGHQSAVTAIDALSRERAITAGGRDNTIRIWKIVEESQLIFNGHAGASVDCVKLVNEDNFVSGGDDGAVCAWSATKKKPLCTVAAAHGKQDNGLPRWITSVAVCSNSDLFASGSHDGFVRLWKLGDRKIEPVMRVPIEGFVNALAFTPDGKTLIAGVGQEHKLARWWKVNDAKNVIYVIPLINTDR